MQAFSGTCGAGTGHPRYRRCTVLYGAASSMLGWRVSTHSVEVCKGTERKRPNMSSEQHTQHTTHTPRRGREKSSHPPTLLSASAGGPTTSPLTETVGQTPEGRGDGRSTAAPLLSALAMDDSEQEFAQLGGGHGRGRLAPYPPTLRGRPPRPRDPYPPSLLPLMLKYQDTLPPPKPRRPCGGECPSFCSAAFDQRAAPFDWRVTLRSKSAPF